MPGYDEATKEITRRFAAHGYLAICPNLYSREAPGRAPTMPPPRPGPRAGCPTTALVGDVGGAAAYLRSLGSSNGKIGHHRVLLGRPPVLPGRLQPRPRCRRRLLRRLRGGAAARGLPRQAWRPSATWPRTCPARCSGCSAPRTSTRRPTRWPSSSRLLDRRRQGVRVPQLRGRRHAFFTTDRPSYRPEAAVEGWQRIWEFFGRTPGHRPERRPTMCTLSDDHAGGHRGQRQGRPGLVPGDRRHRLLRPPRPCHRRPHA